MIFEFEITEVPQTRIPRDIYHGVDGVLWMTLDNERLVFEGILLVEFAWYVKKWLDVTGSHNFHYESVDYEENPLIAFKWNKNQYVFNSQFEGYKNTIKSVTQIRGAFKEYLNSLGIVLFKEYNINLDKIINKFSHPCDI